MGRRKATGYEHAAPLSYRFPLRSVWETRILKRREKTEYTGRGFRTFIEIEVSYDLECGHTVTHVVPDSRPLQRIMLPCVVCGEIPRP
jgi:hypothetical protein